MSKKGGGTANKKEEVSSLYKDLAALRPQEDFEPSTEEYEKAVKVVADDRFGEMTYRR